MNFSNLSEIAKHIVADGKGRHRFSSTYSLHKKNIKLWKNDLIKDE